MENDTLNTWLPFVDFLAEACGSSCEVVLHDLLNPEHSIVAIRNNHISGRSVGEGLSVFARQIMAHGEHKEKNFVTNYFGKAGNSKFLRSSTFFIRDKEGELVGMLGINMDLTPLWEARKTLDQMLSMGGVTNETIERAKNYKRIDLSIEEMLHSLLEKTIEDYGVEPGRMTIEEKKEIVEELNAKGLFLLKGSIAEVAQKLGVSEQTIYRYLKTN